MFGGAVALPRVGLVLELALPALVVEVAEAALDVEGGLAVGDLARVVALAIREPEILTRNVHVPEAGQAHHQPARIVEVAHRGRLRRGLVGGAGEVARPGLAADVPGHHRGICGGDLPVLDLHGLGRGDPGGAVLTGVDRQHVRVLGCERHVAVGEIVRAGLHLLGFPGRDGVVVVHGQEVGGAGLVRADHVHGGSREAPHRRRVTAGVVGAAARRGVVLAANGLAVVARAALAGGTVASDGEGEAEEEEGADGTHGCTCWP